MTPWVTRLIMANVAMFFLTRLAPQAAYQFAFVPALALWRPWTIVTYMFLHAGLGHLFFNMLALYFLGPRLEQHLGARSFLWLYLLSGLMGGVLSIVTPFVAIVGASGAVYGVMLGFAYYWPRAVLHIWGVLPVEARWLVVALTGLSLWMGISGGGNIAHFAHLGGFLGSFLYLRWLEYKSPARQFKKKAAAGVRPKGTHAGTDLQRWQAIQRDRLHEVNQSELDRTLDKISASGIESLTPEERAFLDRFAAR